jgi:hypothetical protein
MSYWFPGRYSLLSCARYTVQGELQQVRQDRTADIHVVFLIQLPGIADCVPSTRQHAIPTWK